jgi:hypothetical protein
MTSETDRREFERTIADVNASIHKGGKVFGRAKVVNAYDRPFSS